MRDHLIDLRLSMADGASTKASSLQSADKAAIAAQHRAALVAALGQDFPQRCASTMSVAQIDCVFDAGDNEAVAACSATR